MQGLPAVAHEDNTGGKTPVLIEWDGAQAIAQLGAQPRLARWEKGKSQEFLKLVQTLKEMRGTHYALFAVRPSGFGTFAQMADQFRKNKIGVGYEPLEQTRSVKLVFRKIRNAPTSR